MNKKLAMGFLVACLVILPLLAAPEKPTFQTAKSRALELHDSLIGLAAPQVRAKVTASARAARAYLAGCRKACDLHAFLTKDIKPRFARAGTDELRLLEALVFAETFKDMAQAEQLRLQDAMQQQQQVLQLISNISKSQHDTLKSIIQNLR